MSIINSNIGIWQVFKITTTLIITLALAFLLFQLREILMVLFAAIIIASAIRPLVEGLTRARIHQGIAILSVYLLIFGGIIGLVIVLAPSIISLIVELFSTGLLVAKLRSFMNQLSTFGWDRYSGSLPSFILPTQLQTLIDMASDTAQQQAWPLARDTIITIGQILLVFVMGFYWLTAREQILSLLLRLSPLSRRSYVELIWNDVEKTLGAFVRVQVILILVVGGAAYVGLVILGIPYAPALAIIAGLTEAIPLVGPFLGAIPAVLVGFTISPTIGLLIAGWYLLIQQLEGNILVPKIMEHQVGLNPLLVLIALIAGGILNGIAGALLAVPIAGALQVIVRHLLIDPTLKSNAPQVENGIVIFDADKPEEATELKYIVAS